MSNTHTGGPAFPVADPFGAHKPQNVDEAKRLAEGMTLRQYAAIKLRVPYSGDEWLDEMIVQSLRVEFAAKAMQALISAYPCQAMTDEYQIDFQDLAADSYVMADAMLKAQEGGAA